MRNDDGPGARDRAADDDRLRREADDEVRDAYAEVVRRFCERADGRLLAAERALDDLDEGGARRLVFRGARVLQVARDRGALRGEGLPAVAVAAGARDGAVLADDHVSELARRAALAAVNLPVEDYPCADAFGDERHDEVARRDGGARGRDVNADGHRARGPQTYESRSPPARRSARADLLDEPLGLQLLDDGRDGRALQGRDARDLCARDGLAVAYVVE